MSKEINVTVNAQQKTIEKGKFSYPEIVELAFPGQSNDDDYSFDIAYKNKTGNKEGNLESGEVLNLKEGMVLYVTRTIKS